MERKTIISKGFDYRFVHSFWEEVQAAFDEGYRYVRVGDLKGAAKFKPRVKVTFEKAGEKDIVIEEVTPEAQEDVVEDSPVIEDSPIDELKKITKKSDLEQFARENNITIPEDIKVVAAIKKFLKDTLEG